MFLTFSYLFLEKNTSEHFQLFVALCNNLLKQNWTFALFSREKFRARFDFDWGDIFWCDRTWPYRSKISSFSKIKPVLFEGLIKKVSRLSLNIWPDIRPFRKPDIRRAISGRISDIHCIRCITSFAFKKKSCFFELIAKIFPASQLSEE